MKSRYSWLVAGLISCGVLASVHAQPDTLKQPVAPLTPREDGSVARLGKTRLRHAEKPTCVVFLPNGKAFATGGEDGTIRVWSVATGEQLNVTQRGTQSVAAMKLTHDGKKLAVHYANESVVRYLDPLTLQETGTIAFPNKHRFSLSRDGKLFASSDAIDNLVVTEVENDLPKLELTQANLYDFRADGKAIAVADTKGTVRVHLVTGGKQIATFKLDATVKGLVYSPDGKQLAVGTRASDGTDVVRVFVGSDTKPVAEIAGANYPQTWIDANRIAVSNGNDAGVYDLKKKEWVSQAKGATGDFAVSPDATKLAATGTGGLRVRLWDLVSGKQLHSDNDTFPDPALIISNRDSLFVIATDTAYFWPIGADAAKTVGTLPGRAVSAAHAKNALVVATPDAVVVYDKFDATQPLPAKPGTTIPDSAGAKIVAISPNGKRVAWTSEGGKVSVVTLEGKQTRSELPATTATVLALAFSPDSEHLAQLGRDTFLRYWKWSPKGEVKELWKSRLGRGQRAAIAFSPDGKYVAAASLAQVPVFETVTGEVAYRLDRYTDEGFAQHVAFSPDGRLLVVASAGQSGRVEVWDTATHGMIRKFTTGYGGISRLSLCPETLRIASAGAEEAITVWELNPRVGKTAPKASDLLFAWNDLESQDAARGYAAIKTLVSGGDQSVATISKGAKEILATQNKVKELIDDLSSEVFSIREQATKALLKLELSALPAVMKATASENPEVRDRAREVLRKLEANGISLPEHGLAADQLRLYRSVQVLEEIGTAEAKSLITTIAAIPGRVGEEAKTALGRMKK